MSSRNLIIMSILALFPLLASGQEYTGSINGRVTDATGAVIPGITVDLSSPAIQGQRQATTGEGGSYQFLFLPPGTYILRFELAGFKSLVREGIIVEVQRTSTINAVLEVATLSETVTVSGESPIVDVQNATVGLNFNQTLLRDLPSARDIWSTLSQTPGIKVTTIDVGGSNAGNQSGYRAYGMQGQVWVNIDGVVTTQATGGAGGYFDYSTFQEIQTAAAANSAEVPVPGTFLNAIIKTGSNQLHGEGYFDWEDDSFQSSNVTSLLSRACVAGQNGPCGLPAGDKFVRYNDFNFNMGGPLKRDKLWWFAAWRDQYSGIQTALRKRDGTPGAIFSTRLQFPTLKLNWQINTRNTFSFTGQANRKFQPFVAGNGRQAAFFNEDSTGNQLSWNWAYKFHWTRVLNSRATLDVSANNFGFHFRRDRRVDEYSRRDLVTQEVRGGFTGVSTGLTTTGLPGPFRQQRRRWHWNGNLSYFKDNFVGGSHNLKFGYGLYWEDYRERLKGLVDHIVLYYRSGVPDSFETHNTSFRSQNSLIQNAIFVQDKWQVGRRLTLNLGFRFDRYTNYYPEQENPGTGPWAEKLLVHRTHISPFNNPVPRLGLIYDLQGNGKTALKLTYGRYAWNTSHEIASAANPNTIIITRYRWDGRLPVIRDPARLVSVLGGTVRSIDSNLKNAHTDEYTAGVDREVLTGFSIRVNFVRKLEHDLRAGVNVATGISGYTPVPFVDVGRDGVRGTADDGTITAFSILPQFRGVTREVVRNFEGVGSNFTTIEIEAVKRLSHRWQLITGADWTKRNLSQSLTLDPNSLIYSGGHYWDWTYKAAGTYEFPKGFNFSTVFKAQKGESYSRRLNVTGLAQGTIGINVEPDGTFAYPTLHLWDMRLEKRFAIGESQRIDTMFDLFNVLNADTILGVNTLTGPTFNRQVTQILNPRIFRLGVRYTF